MHLFQMANLVKKCHISQAITRFFAKKFQARSDLTRVYQLLKHTNLYRIKPATAISDKSYSIQSIMSFKRDSVYSIKANIYISAPGGGSRGTIKWLKTFLRAIL